MKLGTKWQVLIVICIGIFMSTLDGSILNIANPTIARALSVNMQQVQWVVTAYMLVITSSLLIFGKLGDRIGSNKVYTFGFLVFTIGSFFCSLASSLAFLISARIFQAFGASMMMATGIGIVSNTFPASERGKALGLTGSIVGIGNMTGPSLGGFLVANFNWPVVFLINIPIGLAAFLIAYKFLPPQPTSNNEKGYDFGGTALFTISVTILLISLSLETGIDFRLMALGTILLLMFYIFEKNSLNPMLDFQLFKVKNFVYGNILAFTAYSTQTFVVFLMPFYMETLLDFSPSLSGLMMTIPPVSMAITAPLAGNLSDKVGSARITSIALFLITASFLVFSTLEQNCNMFKLAGGLLLMGIGTGAFGSPNSSSIMGSIPREKAGYAGGFISTIRNFSFSLGIVTSVSIFTFFLNSNLQTSIYSAAYVDALKFVYIIAAGITGLGLLFSIITSHSRQVVQHSPDLF